MTRAVRLSLSVVVLAAAAGGTSAGDLGLELRAGYLDLTNARHSAQAVFGTGSGGPMAGAAVRVYLGSFFARAGASYFRRTGERVFVTEDRSESFRLGHPLEITLVPAYVDVCHRFSRMGVLEPYLGFGAGGVLFREESDVAGEILTDERRRPSVRTILGFTAGSGGLRFGAELSYARTPDAIGLGGVSRVYGEKDLGGATLAATVTWNP